MIQRYPNILIYRLNNKIDEFLENNKDKIYFSYKLIDNYNDFNLLFDTNFMLLFLYCDKKLELNNIIPDRFLIKTYWLSDNEELLIDKLNIIINNIYISIFLNSRINIRPIFSVFTTTYNSYDKIIRAYNSLKKQKLLDWEWVILDDSLDINHFDFLKKNLINDKRIRLYNRSQNSGNIGNVKNEVVSLCRGNYLIEFDHDDELLEDTLSDSSNFFNLEENKNIGFLYMNFINLYENGDNFNYGNYISKGYSSYYTEKYNNNWVYVCNTANINNITLTHLTCCPNHPRIWRKDALIAAGNYCEYLPICDDYELILKTVLTTKTAKIPKLGYIQYMNNNNNNFSLIRNEEINRIGPKLISPIFYDFYKIDEYMKQLNGYEDEKYKFELKNHIPLWEREDYEHKFINKVYNINNYKKIICIIGLDSFYINYNEIYKYLNEDNYDFLLLDNKCEIEYLWKFINIIENNINNKFSLFKVYSILNATNEQLIKYFNICYNYLNIEDTIILNNNISIPKYIFNINYIDFINKIINDNNFKSYLEFNVLNIEFFEKIIIDDKCGIKNNLNNLNNLNDLNNKDILDININLYFNLYQSKKDLILYNYNMNSFNSFNIFNKIIELMNNNSILIINNIMPINYYEEKSTAWRFVYYILTNYSDFIKDYNYYNNLICLHFKNLDNFVLYSNYVSKIESYDYFNDISLYVKLLEK